MKTTLEALFAAHCVLYATSVSAHQRRLLPAWPAAVHIPLLLLPRCPLLPLGPPSLLHLPRRATPQKYPPRPSPPSLSPPLAFRPFPKALNPAPSPQHPPRGSWPGVAPVRTPPNPQLRLWSDHPFPSQCRLSLTVPAQNLHPHSQLVECQNALEMAQTWWYRTWGALRHKCPRICFSLCWLFRDPALGPAPERVQPVKLLQPGIKPEKNHQQAQAVSPQTWHQRLKLTRWCPGWHLAWPDPPHTPWRNVQALLKTVWIRTFTAVPGSREMDRVVAAALTVLTGFRKQGEERITVGRIHAVIQTVLTGTRDV